MNENVKPCVKCGATDRKKGGDCRPCARLCSAKWNAAHPEKIKASSAKWWAENIEKAKIRHAGWRADNPEYAAKYYTENSEKEKARVAGWRADNPEYAAKWEAAHPEKRKAINHKRRARKNAAGGSFTAADIKAMLKQQKGKCFTCPADISISYHIDHWMPLALGGHNGIQNIKLLCPHCNLTKHAKHPIDFMQEMGILL